MKTISKLSFKALLDKTKRTQYVDDSLVEEVVPCDPQEIVLFTVGKYISEDALEQEYASRDLEAASPYAIALYDLDHVDEMDQKKYVSTHWKDAKGKWCFATFGNWFDERSVGVYRYGVEWGDGWWFAGVRKLSTQTLNPKTSSVPLDLELRIEKLESQVERLTNYKLGQANSTTRIMTTISPEELRDEIRDILFLFWKRYTPQTSSDARDEIIEETITKLAGQIALAERQKEENVIEIKKQVAGLAGILNSSIQDSGQLHMANMKLDNILALLTPDNNQKV